MRNTIIVVVLTGATALVGLASLYFLNSQKVYFEKPQSITIGNPSSNPLPALIYIADERDFFAENGLKATIKKYATSLEAIHDLKNHKIDVAVTTEYPVIMAAFKKENINIIGCVGKYQGLYLVGRKDRGIEKVTDLKGKKIGLTRGVTGEFYLGRFLDLHGMKFQDVNLVDMKPLQIIDAIVNGDIDAAQTSIFFLEPLIKRLGDNRVIWPAQNKQPGYWVLSSRKDWIDHHPEAIDRFLKSLAQAEEYIIKHPDSAKAIIKNRRKYTNDYLATVWPTYELLLTLDQSLLITMNDEGRWMINNNITSEKTLPDFSNYIYTRSLKKVKPEAVNIR